MFVNFAADVKVHPERRKDVIAAELPSVAIGMQRAIPGYNLTILGDVILKRTNLMEIGQLCTNSMMGMTLDLNMAELYNKEGGNDERVKEWQKTQEPAAGDRSMQPVLVVQGLNDTGVLPYATEVAWERSCKSGNSVQLRLYDGFYHSPTVAASAAEWLAWIRSRFAMKTLPHGCEKKTRAAINKKFVKAPAEFDLPGIVWRS
ncbi:hypothetical protein NW765_017550 [Fusarium oxysporum]|nr:hypothetical protein NW765_017550 [Fusarium oxysporum]KAJ4263701.1 hypothetical protein NW764_016083 [Fusarium oxysporum]